MNDWLLTTFIFQLFFSRINNNADFWIGTDLIHIGLVQIRLNS